MSRNNEIYIAGNIGKEPELSYSKSGVPILKFFVGVNKSRKDEEGNWQTKTTWFPVIAFKDLAENATNELHKGTAVCVSGEMLLRTYETKDGDKKQWAEILAEQISKSIPRYKKKGTNIEAKSFDDMGQPDDNEEIPF